MKTVTLPGEYKSLEKISDIVVQAAREAGLNDLDTYEVDLAVDEACCNIIDHAYGGEGLGDMQCSVEVSDDKLTVVLKDHGRPFDPAKVPEPQLNLPIEKVKRRGVGFFLMHKIMDELHYKHSPEGDNILVLVKHK